MLAAIIMRVPNKYRENVFVIVDIFTIIIFIKETALIYEFTMLELMYYFGILYRMNIRYTRKRTEVLKEFLNLPTIHRRCGTLRYFCTGVHACVDMRVHVCTCTHAWHACMFVRLHSQVARNQPSN